MDYNEIGHQSLAAFVRKVQQVVSDNDSFDYMVAASDSGQLAAYITEEVYLALYKDAPPKFVAPIVRHVDKERTILFDNRILASGFSSWRNKSLEKILFVDDEIWRGKTLKGMLDLLLSLNCKMESWTIVAEEYGDFQCAEIMGDLPATFVPTKQRTPDVYNAFSYTVPLQLQRPIKEVLRDEAGLNDKQVMCTLLGLPIKEWNQGRPRFTVRLIDKAKRDLPAFKEIQEQYREWLAETIQKYLS